MKLADDEEESNYGDEDFEDYDDDEFEDSEEEEEEFESPVRSKAEGKMVGLGRDRQITFSSSSEEKDQRAVRSSKLRGTSRLI